MKTAARSDRETPQSRALRDDARRLVAPYRFTDGARFRLDGCDTDARRDHDRDGAKDLLARCIETLSELQEKLYAQDRWAVLAVFQAMDAAGKDSTIKRVMSGVNPTGCEVRSFKAPTNEDLDHDWLWRCAKVLPERGHIGIFNRSWYEEVLVVRVHPEILASQKVPAALVTKNVWKERFEDIAAFERHLARNGVLILKFFLHVSKKEQKKRFLERIDRPEKNWKFSPRDVHERAYWDDYQKAYEDAIRATAKPHAPWYVVPADDKWFMQIVVASALVDALSSLDLALPRLGKVERAALAEARALLLRDAKPRRSV